ncbi:MAG: thymidine kinase, partial [Deltaproteobacteria bacterium]|nr:thymidine kinase [Deltaproteobacteria bacterium]
EVICGPMFSGKSEELIRRLRRARIARQRVQVFKSSLDDRYDEQQIVSHSEQALQAEVVKSSQELWDHVDDRVEVLGIDEVQFFDDGIVSVCEKLANLGKRVIVAGLDLDYRGQPFYPVPHLMAVAEYVTKALAVCSRCGAPASRSQRIMASDERIVVGAIESYEARCRHHFEPEMAAQLAMELKD